MKLAPVSTGTLEAEFTQPINEKFALLVGAYTAYYQVSHVEPDQNNDFLKLSGELRAEVSRVRDQARRREGHAGGDGGQDRGHLQEERGGAEGECGKHACIHIQGCPV